MTIQAQFPAFGALLLFQSEVSGRLLLRGLRGKLALLLLVLLQVHQTPKCSLDSWMS